MIVKIVTQEFWEWSLWISYVGYGCYDNVYVPENFDMASPADLNILGPQQ
jgi:hypothetical protein